MSALMTEKPRVALEAREAAQSPGKMRTVEFLPNMLLTC